MSLPVETFSLVKNEGLYLAEWVEFMLAQGVRAIHLYDNGSTDDTLAVADRYPLVDVTPQPGPAQQFPMHSAIIAAAREPCWGAFIDADEYLYCPMGWSLPEALQPYEGHGAVGVCWVVYGPDGQQEYDHAPVRQRFRRGRLDCHIKSVVKLPGKELGKTWNPHCFNLEGGTVDELHRPIKPLNPWMSEPTASRLRIDHYSFKSVAEHRIKCARGYSGACGGGTLDADKRLAAEERRIAEWLKTNKQIAYP